jgi:uncharacterized protein YpbB
MKEVDCLKVLLIKELARFLSQMDSKDLKDSKIELNFPCGSRFELRLVIVKAEKLKLMKNG